MRLSELSQASGFSPATIKFYLREGLLFPGRPTGRPKLADYGSDHVSRLRLIHTLTHVGGLSLAAVRSVIEAIDDPRRSVHDVLGVAQGALAVTAVPATGEDVRSAGHEIDAYLAERGWHVPSEGSAAKDGLAAALVALRRLGWDCDARVFDTYADLADTLAARELATVPASASREQIAESAIVGTVVFEAALIALRRLAHAHHSGSVFG